MRVSLNRSGMKAAAAVAAAGLCLGCAGGRQDTPVNTGLAHLESGNDPVLPALPPAAPTPPEHELQRLAAESAANLQAIFDAMNRDAEESLAAADPPPAQPEPTEPEEPIAAAAAEPDEPSPAEETLVEVPLPVEPEPTEIAEGPPAPEEPAEVQLVETSEPTLEEQIRKHAIVLVDLFRQQSVASEEPLRHWLALASLELIWPGALQKIISPDAPDGGLTPGQILTVEGFRDFVAAMAVLPEHEGSEAEYLMDLADELWSSRPMRIRRAVLCTRVTGYGQYVPVQRTRFLQGHNHPVIVYAEIAPFAHRKATSEEASRAMGGANLEDGDAWAVELSQEVQVFHDSDGLLVWSRPAERVLEVSRNRRRDFFLVNRIVLPRTLSVGRYQMKIIMRDKTSGAVDEALIPFEVVADPALASGARD